MPSRSTNSLESRKRALAKRILESNDERVIADVSPMSGESVPFVSRAELNTELDESLDRYLRGESTTYTWEEVLSHVREQGKRS